MPRTTILPVADYPAGTRTIGPANIQNGLTTLTVAIARCTAADLTIWPNRDTKVALSAEVTTEPGANATWNFVSGMTAEGGIHIRRDGSESPESTWTVSLPPGTNRRLRIQSNISTVAPSDPSTPLRTSVTVVTV